MKFEYIQAEYDSRYKRNQGQSLLYDAGAIKEIAGIVDRWYGRSDGWSIMVREGFRGDGVSFQEETAGSGSGHERSCEISLAGHPMKREGGR